MSERREHDFYETPAFCVTRLLETQGDTFGRRILEPSAGDGAIVRAVDEFYAELGSNEMEWTLIELREERRKSLAQLGRVHIGDFLSVTEALRAHEHDTIIGNPPFSLAEEFVRSCVDLARSWKSPGQTIMLLRLAFLETKERVTLFRDLGMPDVYVLPNRPSFTANGSSDTAAYAWMRWPAEKQTTGRVRVLASTPLHQRRAS